MKHQNIYIENKEENSAAYKSLMIEATAILHAAKYVSESILKATYIILQSEKKVIITGLGKSGLIAQKIASTFRSIGINAHFMHATEAIHGDLGMYESGDVTIMISKSGTTSELIQLIPTLRSFNSAIIAIVGNLSTGLALEADCIIDASVKQEADLLNLAPTASSTLALALGDAIAATIMEKTAFTKEKYAVFHPGGQLGKNLGVLVEGVMHRNVQLISTDSTLKEAVIALSLVPLGAVCVVCDDKLEGIITDGDVRRAIEKDIDIKTLKVSEVMTINPVKIHEKSPLTVALGLMENRKSQISVLPVVSNESKLVGLIRLHDIYRASGK